jgi:Co/Zn/Cd efflux system component
MGAEAIDVVASVILAVVIFRRAFEAEERMMQIPVEND